MVVRQPVAAGRFYAANPEVLRRDVAAHLAAGAALARRMPPLPDAGIQTGSAVPWALMLPHAGHVFSGDVTGATLNGWPPMRRILVLCPNHTGRGQALGVWPGGPWLTPLGPVPTDQALTAALVQGRGFTPDALSHLGEHSIEVILPFLQAVAGEGGITGMAAVCVGTRNPEVLAAAGASLGVILARPDFADVRLVISSDMNHYENETRTRAKDDRALAEALRGDADGLLRVVEDEDISMCGAAPLALALYAARTLGRVRVELAAHDTSATASGDTAHTVGYAGLRLSLEPRAARTESPA